MTNSFIRIGRFILRSQIRTAFVVFIAVLTSVIILSARFYGREDFIEGILIEAHGMLLDILVIGILILWLNEKREESFRNERYQDEIDDFRGWQSEEAMYRIRGNIKRLNANGVTNINLYNCYMKNVKLAGVNLSEASLQGSDVGNGYFVGAILKRARFEGAYMGDVNLRGANLRGANLERARCQRANLRGVDFRDASLVRAQFWEADLHGANCRGADLRDANFRDANLRSVDFIGSKNNVKSASLRRKV